MLRHKFCVVECIKRREFNKKSKGGRIVDHLRQCENYFQSRASMVGTKFSTIRTLAEFRHKKGRWSILAVSFDGSIIQSSVERLHFRKHGPKLECVGIDASRQ